MVKRSTVTGIYDSVHKFSVRCCWAVGLGAGALVLIKACEILLVPKKLAVTDLPEYKKMMTSKEPASDELLKE